ncbi:MAG: UDP-glucose 4-epimerase [Thermoleophilaceae bacterium]|nr:UDP-glucose 4-epimerase [Thermoleophilaceae bacterium]MEA2388386.1 UDP-glucose 4-epimerase [Thermoleophilaceae bacterium]
MRYVITGGSGYIGSRLIERLVEREDTERVVIADIRPPRSFRPKVEFSKLDVRDAAGVRALLERERPDAVVHLAFVLNPMHDENTMYDIDVGGTHNVLEAASASGVGQMLVTSSATAYGAFPDNPVPIDEDWPVRGVPDFEYARDKTESDRLCQLWALKHPDRVMTIVRPCIVFGPNVDNYIVRAWTKQPFFAEIGGSDTPVQFVHEDDVVEALIRLLEGRHAGAFNLAGDGTMTWGEAADLIGTPRRKAPKRLFWRFANLMWKLRASESPAGNLHFIVHPWVVSTDRLKQATGWAPAHTSRDTFEITMRTHGKLPPADGTAVEKPELAAPVGA